jgi:molybdopterin-guanine dinucleotide biosynthesis protein A
MTQIFAPLTGLVLAGGQGSRLGRDKGELVYPGRPPQARWAHGLLAGFCERVYVSVRPAQADAAVYAGLPLVLDREAGVGPAAGLAAAWRVEPAAAWLVLAVDLPRVGADLLERLVAARTTAALGVAFRHPDGPPEPLCAVYEPGARLALEGQPEGRRSLRHLLETGPTALLEMRDPNRLHSVNTPEDDAAVRRELGAG